MVSGGYNGQHRRGSQSGARHENETTKLVRIWSGVKYHHSYMERISHEIILTEESKFSVVMEGRQPIYYHCGVRDHVNVRCPQNENAEKGINNQNNITETSQEKKVVGYTSDEWEFTEVPKRKRGKYSPKSRHEL